MQALIDAGWELEHAGLEPRRPDRRSAPPNSQRRSRAPAGILQRRYHVPVNWFCYPSGHYDAAVVEEVKRAGYVGSTTVIPGWAHAHEDPYRMHRLRVLGGTSGQQLDRTDRRDARKPAGTRILRRRMNR